METLKARSTWSEVFLALILSRAKLSFKIDEAIKVFNDKQKQYMTTKSTHKRFFKEFCTQKMKANKTMKIQAVPNQRRKKGKKVESNIDLTTYNQTLKQ
jgi:hypothetical protein